MKQITPYLIFDGNCRDAMTFYKQCIGGELSTTTFGEGEPSSPPEAKDRLMHARLERGSTLLMASDSMQGMPVNRGNNFFLSIACDSVDEVKKLFASLSAGGKPSMPPADTFWNAHFAMFTDKFAMNWMLNFEYPKKT